MMKDALFGGVNAAVLTPMRADLFRRQQMIPTRRLVAARTRESSRRVRACPPAGYISVNT